MSLFGSSANVEYPDLADSPLNSSGKPTRSWMRDWTQEERTEKFFEFCRAYDQREDDILRDNYQQFSHRLHWHECPFVETAALIDDPARLLEACVLFSFTNEHWQTFTAWAEGRLSDYVEGGNRPCRSDLFQIYYPRGTEVGQWLTWAPGRVGRAMAPTLTGKNRPWTMMEFAKALDSYFTSELGFRSAMYPSKNATRHVAMSHPEWVDPESFLHGGTGFFDGLHQVFDVDLRGKARYSIGPSGEYEPNSQGAALLLDLMGYLRDHPSNPIKEQKYLNIEDKLCFMWKHVAIRNGAKSLTRQIPYEWVYPAGWSLRTGRYDDGRQEQG